MSDDELDRWTDQTIERVGWAVIGVSPDEGEEGADFAYTVGLTARGLPELTISGLRQPTMQTLLNDVAQRLLAGTALAHGQRLGDVVVGFDLVVVDGTDMIDRDTIWPGLALERYGPVRLLQLVWPDKAGLFPWEPGYGFPAGAQPVLATP